MSGIGQLWERQPAAASLVHVLLEQLVQQSEFAQKLRLRLLHETGTRLIDWVDHLAVPRDFQLDDVPVEQRLTESGFELATRQSGSVYRNQQGLFPPVEITEDESRLVLKVESVLDFLVAHQLSREIQGPVFTALRKARVCNEGAVQIWVCERWGASGWDPDANIRVSATDRQRWLERAMLRKRDFETAEQGFDHAQSIIAEGVDLLGQDQACALFFHAERRYWQGRNQAAQRQKSRQDRLGMGWANHDHHTYRSSRNSFRHLVQSLRQLGFEFRERFYAGEEAGWGAQVLEQAHAGITVFADVDLAADEIVENFPEQGLQDRTQLGTVGLWCALHGEAFLEAGMHHLECQFEFAAARQQLAEEGAPSMPPFTNFDYLKQSFTEGQVWSVTDGRIKRLLAEGRLTQEQAQRFREQGAVGSHLEILQRDDGFKGFNQTGISDIIRKTDPRQLRV